MFIVAKKKYNELEAKHQALLDKSLNLAKQRDLAEAQVIKTKQQLDVITEKYKGFEMAAFNYHAPEAFDMTTLSPEERVEHLRQIDYMHNAAAFHRELNALMQDMNVWLIVRSEDTTGHALSTIRQLITFVQGLKDRFAQLSTKFRAEYKIEAPAQTKDIIRS